MIKSKDVYDEINILEKTMETLDSAFEKASLKAYTLLLKLVLNVRQNQAAIMEHEGIQLKKPDEKSDSKK